MKKIIYVQLALAAAILWGIGVNVDNSKPIPWIIENKQDVIHAQRGNGEWVQVCLEYSIHQKTGSKGLMDWDLQSVPSYLYHLRGELYESNKSSLKSKLNAKLDEGYKNGIHWEVRIDSVIYIKKE